MNTEKLRGLLAKATTGTWKTTKNSAGYMDIYPNANYDEKSDHEWRGSVASCHEAEHIDGLTAEEMRANAELICELRNNAEALLDRVDALEAALREAVWRDREMFPNDPYCVLCGTGKAWAEKHGHQQECALHSRQALGESK